MAQTYTAAVSSITEAVTSVTIAFGTPAANTNIVPDAIAAIAALHLHGGPAIHFNGPASLPAAMAIAHAVAHLYGYVACYDPKLQGYVVAISHDPAHRPGALIPA